MYTFIENRHYNYCGKVKPSEKNVVLFKELRNIIYMSFLNNKYEFS